jgi:DNA-binding MarR family transcriptional regulator
MPRVAPQQRPQPPPAPAPMIGALLRLPHEAVLARIQAALAREGLDITSSELGVFLFPGPDGRRPIDLARQCAMTRQAMNYVLAGLERRSYLERHDAATARGRVVRVTERGRKAIRVIRGEVTAIEQEWAEHLGARRFEALRGSLSELAIWLGKLG